MTYTTPNAGELTELIARAIRHRGQEGSGIAPHQRRALRVASGGPIRPARMAEQLRISPRAVTEVVDHLEAAGLVTTEPDPEDRRAKIVALTAAGRREMDRTAQQRREVAREIFGVLSDAERAELTRLLAKVADSLD